MTMMHTFLSKTIRKDFQIKFHAALLTHPRVTLVKLANRYLILAIQITLDELQIVLHSRKTLLFWNQNTWVKKHGNEDFDILWDVMMEQKYVS